MKKEAFEVLLNRRAIRSFKEDPVPQDVLQAILEAGTYAPSAMGRQSAFIVAAQTPETVEKLEALNAKVMGDPDARPYYNAPVILLVLSEQKNEFLACEDGSAVVTNLVNAAYAAGVGSCWINRCKEMFELPEGKALLKEWGLSEDLTGIAGIALGYAQGEAPQPRPRKEGYFRIV